MGSWHLFFEQFLWLFSLQMGWTSLFLHVRCGCVLSEHWACGSACVGPGGETPLGEPLGALLVLLALWASRKRWHLCADEVPTG